MESSAPRFEVLPGLPPYGPPAHPFPVDGKGSHHEGFVVRFFPKQNDAWVGNFQGGLSRFSSVQLHPDGLRLVVISDGQGYIINPDRRGQAEEIGGWYVDALIGPTHLFLITPVDIEAFDAAGRAWRTRRLSWDGLRDVHLSSDGSAIRGEGWTPLGDHWVPFDVEISSGSARGGAYNKPD